MKSHSLDVKIYAAISVFTVMALRFDLMRDERCLVNDNYLGNFSARLMTIKVQQFLLQFNVFLMFFSWLFV